MAMPGKPPRKKIPREVAVIHQSGCTGCEACIVVCPVDCIELIPGSTHPTFMKLVEVDLERCIGCRLCAKFCPWDTIFMYPYEEGLKAAPQATMRSVVPGQRSDGPLEPQVATR